MTGSSPLFRLSAERPTRSIGHTADIALPGVMRKRGTRQRAGTPLSSCSPASSKVRPEPGVRSRTTDETQISEAPASAPIRAAMLTVPPVTSSPNSRSHRRGRRADLHAEILEVRSDVVGRVDRPARRRRCGTRATRRRACARSAFRAQACSRAHPAGPTERAQRAGQASLRRPVSGSARSRLRPYILSSAN